MNGYSPKDINAGKAMVAPAGEITSTDKAGLTGGGATRGFRVDFALSGVAGAITYKLQHMTIDGFWDDLVGANASVAQVADGAYSLTQLYSRSADEPNFPCRKQLRVVATGAGSATVDKMSILQEI